MDGSPLRSGKKTYAFGLECLDDGENMLIAFSEQQEQTAQQIRLLIVRIFEDLAASYASKGAGSKSFFMQLPCSKIVGVKSDSFPTQKCTHNVVNEAIEAMAEDGKPRIAVPCGMHLGWFIIYS